MAIIHTQRRLAEVGRIRIGHQVPTGGGRSRPAKLDRLRFTSADRRRIDQLAHLYGGDVEPWESPAGQQWQVITDTADVPVVIPPGELSFSQWYELWSRGGCQRRCDGSWEQLGDQPCVCDPDARDCTPHTRLSVMLRDLEGLGLWRLDTQGHYAMHELAGAFELIQMAAGQGALIPARLRVEQRAVVRDGQTRKFPVPMIDLEITGGQLVSGAPQALGMPAAGLAPQAAPSLEEPSRRQLDAGGPVDTQVDEPPPFTPVPAENQQHEPAPSIGEQMGRAAEQRSRRRGQVPIPDPGLPDEDGEPAVEHPDKRLLARAHAIYRDVGLDKDVVAAVMRRRWGVSSHKDAPADGLRAMLDWIEAGGHPPTVQERVSQMNEMAAKQLAEEDDGGGDADGAELPALEADDAEPDDAEDDTEGRAVGGQPPDGGWRQRCRDLGVHPLSGNALVRRAASLHGIEGVTDLDDADAVADAAFHEALEGLLQEALADG